MTSFFITLSFFMTFLFLEVVLSECPEQENDEFEPELTELERRVKELEG